MAFSLNSIRGDIYGGLTAAVVALPLALAFGVASGAGAIAGLYGAIACGFFAAVLGGTRAQVSGPTGPMTVVMAAVVAQYANDLGQAFAIVVLGGALQIVLGFLRVGRFVSYTPYTVVSGFMSGIGAIIILIQTLPFFGLATAGGGPLGAISAWPRIAAELNWQATVIGALALAVMIFWPKRWSERLPAPLAALVAGTLLSWLVLSDAPVIGEVPTGLPTLLIPKYALADLPQILQPALVLALLGSIDSLLTSLVADSITRTRHNSNRELIGQGVGNMVAGLIGGLPGAGATMRTVVNVRAGGRTPVSGALHSVILLALLLGLGPVAEKVPHAALAGILLKVGWDIIDWGYLRRIRNAPREKVFVMLVTLFLTVFVDLITAVAVGMILAGFVTARWMERDELGRVTRVALPREGHDFLSAEERERLAPLGDRVEVILLRGSFSYASARQLADAMGTMPGHIGAVILDFSEASYVDTSAALAIDEIIIRLLESSDVHISALNEVTRRTLDGLQVLRRIPAAHQHTSRLAAIRAVAGAVKAVG